ncbi:MAG: hypothetical protein ACTHZ9_13100, partial [Leucobacter sp.]
MSSSNTTRFKKLGDAAAVVTSLIGVIAGFIAAFLVTAALVGQLPWWAALPLGFIGLIVFFGGSGSLMYKQGSPTCWLTVSGCGALLAFSPAAVLLVYGSSLAEFTVPGRRGRSIEMSVDTLTAFVVPVGVAIAVVGLAAYLLHPK